MVSAFRREVYVVVAVAIGTYGLLYYLFIKIWFSPLRKIPGPHHDQSLLRRIRALIYGSTHAERTKDYGPVVRFRGPLGQERVMFLEPSALQRILVDKCANYPRNPFIQRLVGFTAGYGLFTLSGEKHKLMRKTMNPAFSLTNLIAQTDMYYPPLEKLVGIFRSMISELPDPREGTQIFIYEWISKLTLDIVCATAFDYYPDALGGCDDELSLAYHRLADSQNGRNMTFSCLSLMIPGLPNLLRSHFAAKYLKHVLRGPLRLLRTLTVSVDTIKTIARQMLDKKLAEADLKEFEGKRDIMSLLVRAYLTDDPNDFKLSEEDFTEQVLTFLGAGHESTAAGVSWTLWLLSQRPECQDRLRKEVLPAFQTNSMPSYRDLKSLTYLDNVIMESLRLFPPAPLTLRTAQNDDWIDGCFIPKGTCIHISIRAVNTWTKIWGPDAKTFRPERWSDLPSTYHPAFSLLSFIAGPHSCIGRTMAIMVMKTIIAVLISNFSFEPAYEGQTAHPAAGITMRPMDNLPLKVKLVGPEQ